MKLAVLALVLFSASTIFGQSYDAYDQVRTDPESSTDVKHNGPIQEIEQTGDIPTGDLPVVIDFEGLKDDELEFASRGEVSIEEDKSISLNVYPNPTAETLVLGLTSLEKGATISIIDLSGRLVKAIEIERSSITANLKVDIASWTAGLYFVVYEKDARREITKFQKI